MEQNNKNIEIYDFIIALVPLVIGKVFLLYFGMNYSNYPGQGYGIGLAISVIFTILMVARFLWKYRHYED